MKNLLILTLICLTLFPSNLSTGKTVDDCYSHNERCEEDCYGEFENVRHKSETTRKYLDRCLGICERRNTSCVERVKELKAVDNSLDYTYPDEDYSGNRSVSSPTRIYKFKDDSGHYHVVDDIDKIPAKYRDQVEDEEE